MMPGVGSCRGEMIPSLTVSQATPLATGTSGELSRQGSGESNADCGDGVCDVTLGADRGLRGVGNWWVSEAL